MRTSTTDPTAGRTARALALDPGAARPVADPTDPRQRLPRAQPRASAAGRRAGRRG